MSEYKIDGTVLEVLKEIQVTDTFKKRELILETGGAYPQTLKIEFKQDKCIILNGIKQGDAVSIDVNINGRKWINKKGEAQYFTTINGWRIEVLAASMPTQDPPTIDGSDGMADDLPF
jgi:hypothetical protein